ncbi:hypothetical protein [Microbacterium aurum]
MTGDPAERISYDVFALADIRHEKYRDLSDAVDQRLAEFRCHRSAHLQDFARAKVRKWEGHGHSRTYVIVTAREDSIDVAGFFTVGMTALNFENAAPSVRKKLMGDVSMSHTGAYSIAELARADDYSSEQLPGATILDEAKGVIKRARAYVAGRFVVVDARVEVFERLYAPAGFKRVDVASPPIGMDDVEFVTACAVVKDW